MPIRHARQTLITIIPAILNVVDDSTTYYFGCTNAAPTSAPAYRKLYIGLNGIITRAEISICTGTSASAEHLDWYVRVNNTTDYLLYHGALTADITNISVTGLNIPIKPTDYIEIKFITPAWVTNPDNLRAGVLLILQ
jgi:hypothetical protein